MTTEKPASKAKKIFGIILNVLTYIFFAICIIALIFTITSKRDADGATTIFGMQFRVVISDSMAKCDQTDVSAYEIKDIPIKSLVFIELVPEDEAEAENWYASLKDGDVLTFKYQYMTQETITHRVVGDPVKNENGGYTINLEGDNKASENSDTLTQVIDTSRQGDPDYFNYVIGKVVGQSYPAGLFISALKGPIGIICFIIIPCVIIAIFEVIRLINALTETKKKKEREEQDKRDAEFEQMKQQLELLRQMQMNGMASAPEADKTEPPKAQNDTAETAPIASKPEENTTGSADLEDETEKQEADGNNQANDKIPETNSEETTEE